MEIDIKIVYMFPELFSPLLHSLQSHKQSSRCKFMGIRSALILTSLSFEKYRFFKSTSNINRLDEELTAFCEILQLVGWSDEQNST